MAVAKSIRARLDDLNEQMCELDALQCLLRQLPDEVGKWPFLIDRLVGRVLAASEELEIVLRQQALPLLEGRAPVEREIAGQDV